ncbi:chemotaxis protein CheB [Chitinimonas sp. BJB300]|nr:chemotaxis protein CheB [Chitinimonas sp. BJB300]TSJ84696.1 chemotaxis protein CheB [Chitinimonas sp. BJB300]
MTWVIAVCCRFALPTAVKDLMPAGERGRTGATGWVLPRYAHSVCRCGLMRKAIRLRLITCRGGLMSHHEPRPVRHFKKPSEPFEIPPSLTADAVLPLAVNPLRGPAETLIIVGASTGGTEALKHFLVPLPEYAPPVLIAQHMPEMFTAPFAARLDSLCRMKVKQAEHNEPVLQGHVYVAPGHSHLLLGVSNGRYICVLSQAPPVNRHRPSVDVLFRSAANSAGRYAVGAILTGMGRDGATGMLEMKQAGARTFAQDEATCVVFGMPKEAIALGGVDEVLPIEAISTRILAFLREA